MNIRDVHADMIRQGCLAKRKGAQKNKGVRRQYREILRQEAWLRSSAWPSLIEMFAAYTNAWNAKVRRIRRGK